MTGVNDRHIPPLAGGSTENNLTASWRHLTPRYRELRTPCADSCAAGVRPELFLRHLSEGEVEGAFREVLKSHPFPGIMGRVCYRGCETKCNREYFDRSVAIGPLERVIGDAAIDEGFDLCLPRGKNNRRAGVIGAGPAGLSFLFHMRKAGFFVTLFDMKPPPGGMMRHVIPNFRLPPKVVEAELRRLLREGVSFVKKRFTLEDIAGAGKEFDVLLLATGAWQSAHPVVDRGAEVSILDAIQFLERVKDDPIDLKGKRVVVIGGGNSAIDSARTALRLGGDVDIFYRRDERDMPAYGEEILEAVKEGVQFHFRAIPSAPLFSEGAIRGVKMARTEIIRDRSTDPRGKVIILKGTEFDISCDFLILATGENPLFSETNVAVGENLYIAGDAVAGAPRNVTHSLGSGMEAARRFLTRSGLIHGSVEGEIPPDLAGADIINGDYIRPAFRLKVKVLPMERRTGSFEEVESTAGITEAAGEARRCLSCGVCNGCDNCRVFCPDGAVKADSGTYEFSYDHCKGCGICWTECPRGAIGFSED